MHTKVLIDIRFNSSIYTVSEDDSFVDLTIVKNISDAESAKENITFHFSTSDLTAKGTCMCTIISGHHMHGHAGRCMHDMAGGGGFTFETLDHVPSSCIIIVLYRPVCPVTIVSFWMTLKIHYTICMNKKWWAFYRHACPSMMNGLGGMPVMHVCTL